ncbi:MAG: nucleoid-associated protein, partial [Clostridia bacterium]|nr:nucleoid-associated protein [Clostridia bacterium]
MRNIDEIIINKVFISVLDKENNSLLLSDNELELNEETYEYFEKHILKSIKDDEAKSGKFEGDVNIAGELCKEIFEDNESFAVNAKKLSQYLFKCMGNEDKEPSGDFAVCLCDSQLGAFLALMKLNYANSYSHFVKQDEGNVTIDIGTNKTGLPGLGQKPAKAVFVKPFKPEDPYDFLICDKQPEGYFSQAFIKVSPVRDRRENTRIIQKTS